MKTQKNIAEFQEKFIVPVPADIAKIVDERDRKILADAYLKLFSGFSWVNWTNGHSLGRAWQTALTQCATFVKTKKGKNHAQKHLRNVYNSHKKYWSRVIMTHRDSENKISGTSEWVAQMRAYGTQLIREAMDKINLILARYNERVEEFYIEQMMAHKSGAQQVETNTVAMGGANQAGNAILSGNNAAGNTNSENAHQAKNQAINQATKQKANQAQSGASVTQPHKLAIPAQQSTQQQQAQPEMKAVSAKQAALERAIEKLAQPQVALPQVGSVQTARQQATQQQTTQQQAAQRPQLSGLVQRNMRPMPHVMNVEKLQQSVARPAVRKPQVALPQVSSVQTARQQATQQQTTQQQAAQRPQLSGLVQRNVRPMPHVMNVEKLQQSVNNAVKTSHRPNMNMLLFKNFHQRVA